MTPSPEPPPGALEAVNASRELWVFGYGSLVWRPAFAHEEQHAARVHGWARQFWQGSTDHRGVPGAPGRVVTVLLRAGAQCWGRAYRVGSRDESEVLDRLDHREQGGYSRCDVQVELCGERAGTCVAGFMYAAAPGNPNYLGPAPLDAIARQVCASRGPSGHNADYVLQLASALREMGAEDEHVFAVEACVRAQLAA